jgi:N-acetylneuraminic acid mutarotase
VWTGSGMVVWGGNDFTSFLNTGGRFNPSTDMWTATSTANAPAGRSYHTTVWTGSEMIVWGGSSDLGFFDTGGRFSPSTDSWTATSTTNAPTGRQFHTAVWDDVDRIMIVWGGDPGTTQYFDTGGR